MFPLPWAFAEGLKGVTFSLALGSGWRCVLDVDAVKICERRNCTISVLTSASTKFKCEEINGDEESDG